jgi:arylsulfatase A-like enzyme
VIAPLLARPLRSVVMLVGLSACSGAPPDVVLLTIDTLRVDHVGAFSSASPALTPNIDALAAEGTRYSQAFSPISVTGPAFCSLMTGQEPGTHGVMQNVFRDGAPLGDAAETLAERLQQGKWATGAFVSGFTLRRALGLNQGFDDYSGPRGKRRSGSATTSKAVTWLLEQKGPLLLWWHNYDVHGPLERWWEEAADGQARIPAYQRSGTISDPKWYQRQYARAVEEADRQVGQVVAALKQAGRYDNALIVLTADHGESFTERELWFDHGTTPYVEQLQVPLVIKWPGGKRAGEVRAELVSLTDLAPTVLDVVGLSPLGRTTGLSLVGAGPGHPLLGGESSHCKAEDVLSCTPKGPQGKLYAVRDSTQTLVWEPRAEGPQTLVYDRVQDPLELAPTTVVAPEVGPAALAEALAALRAEPLRALLKADSSEGGGEGDDDAEAEALRSLGYIE